MLGAYILLAQVRECDPLQLLLQYSCLHTVNFTVTTFERLFISHHLHCVVYIVFKKTL
jgi:hypothetical protein